MQCDENDLPVYRHTNKIDCPSTIPTFANACASANASAVNTRGGIALSTASAKRNIPQVLKSPIEKEEHHDLDSYTWDSIHFTRK